LTADKLTLAKLEEHFEQWEDFMTWQIPSGKRFKRPDYPSVFPYAYQPTFNRRLEELNSLGDNLKDTMLRVTGGAWAIPSDGRINISFCLQYLLDPTFLLDEPQEDVLEYAASELKNLGNFDRKLHSSENRVFFVADIDPWNKSAEFGYAEGDNYVKDGSFVVYRFGPQIPRETHFQLDKRTLFWETQKIEIGYQWYQ
jgi:hypothetical protein